MYCNVNASISFQPALERRFVFDRHICYGLMVSSRGNVSPPRKQIAQPGAITENFPITMLEDNLQLY